MKNWHASGFIKDKIEDMNHFSVALGIDSLSVVPDIKKWVIHK